MINRSIIVIVTLCFMNGIKLKPSNKYQEQSLQAYNGHSKSMSCPIFPIICNEKTGFK